MTTAGQFITALEAEQKIGNVSAETEQHLKHEFRKLGKEASGTILAAAVGAEISRLQRQAATLRRLREGVGCLGSVGADGLWNDFPEQILWWVGNAD